jgi:hypothetical protein
MPPRAAQLMQPARGQMRIGILQGHETGYFLFEYSLKISTKHSKIRAGLDRMPQPVTQEPYGRHAIAICTLSAISHF